MNIKKRLLPAALIVILTVGCSLLCRETRILFFAALAAASAFELETVMDAAAKPVPKWPYIIYILCHAVLCWMRVGAEWLIALFALAAFAVSLCGILRSGKGAERVVDGMFCLMWPFGFYALVLSAAASERWLPVLSLGILGSWACDSMALIGGKLYGKRKLAPAVSPNKTWEGAVTGAVFSVIAGWLISLVLKGSYPLPAPVCMITALLASSFGQVGDLAASLIKRMAGVKDYGHLMPEHGGIMDKMDSMLFSIPSAWMFLHVFGLFGMG